MRALAATAALTVLVGRAAEGAQSVCPCLTSFPAAWAQTWVVNSSCQLFSGSIYGNTQHGDFCYPADYGLSNCSAWDEGTPPSCTQANAPSWCSDQWCYVNVSSCSVGDATISVRGLSGAQAVDVPHYSYTTCGFQSDFAKYQRAAKKSAQEIVSVVEAYVAQLRDGIERQVPTLTSAETGTCPTFVDSCDCGQCRPGAGSWQSGVGVTTPGYKVDFRSVSVTHFDGSARDSKTPAEQKAQCLAQLEQDRFKRIARLEYNDPARMAFLQYGDQASGVYFSWPGVSFCPTKFDPRFRPWYVSAVSGPKDVVIILDRSGSMNLQNRWNLAKEATKQVLGTLTAFDYANIVAFSSDAYTYEDTAVLQDVTQAKLQLMRDWLDSQVPAGGTSFRSGFQKAFQLLAQSRSQGTTECNQLILFLTDGEDTSNFAVNELQRLNTRGVTIFTYSFGSSADTVRPKEIACQNKGIWYHVNDGADIGQVMSGYYLYYAGALANTKQIRWTMYKEFTTNNDLITGCLPAYDRTSQQPQLLGVVCMDVSVIMSVTTFRSKPDYAAANALMVREASTCTHVNLSSSKLESLRRAVSPSSSCLSTSSASGCRTGALSGLVLATTALLLCVGSAR